MSQALLLNLANSAMAAVVLSEQTSRILVEGYIHEQYNKEIPSEIIGLCLIFYFINRDIWDADRKHEAIEVDKVTNTIKTIGSHVGYAHIAGTALISKSTDMRIWKFLYIKYGTEDCPYFMISLVPNEQDLVSDGRPIYHFAYTYDAWSGSVTSYLKAHSYDLKRRWMKPGEILTIKYETVESKENGIGKGYTGELYYGVDIGDDESLLIKGFDDIPIDNGEVYVIAVSFHNADIGETLQMLQ